MEKNTITILIGTIALLIGLGGGYIIGVTTHENVTAVSSMPGMDMQSSMQGMMSGLQGKTGDDFDKEFLAEMIVHHQGAVDMAKQVLATSKRPELISLANAIISAQTKEIQMMQGWEKSWFNQ